MAAYLLRRGIKMIAVLLLSSLVIYGLLSLVPGGPLAGLKFQGTSSRDRVTNEDVERLSVFYDLDLRVTCRFTRWLVGWPKLTAFKNDGSLDAQVIMAWCKPALDTGASHRDKGGMLLGDMGRSWKVAKGIEVSRLIRGRLGNTVLLMGAATLLSLLIAVPIGIYSAVRQYSRFDYIATTASFFGIAMPVFWFGLLMIMLFAYNFKRWGLPYLPTGNITAIRSYTVPLLGTVAPESGLDRILHLIMPTIVLSLLYMAQWSRFTRSSMLEVLRQDYVRTARAKGLLERVVVTKHALRNALIPLVTIVTLQIPGIFSGAILTETVFNWQGMGRLYISALSQSDWPVVMALLFITAVLFVFSNLLADVMYTIVDPRIRYA